MEFQWEFFETLNESVYVSDPETYELVYMNAYLRKTLGLSAQEDYRGKPCYTLLQGRSRPCEFCTNCKLRQGEFYEWSYRNPFLGQDFYIMDTLVERNGRPYRLELAIGRDSISGCRSDMPYIARSDTVISECLQHVYSNGSPDEALMELLAYIGREFHCERTYIFEDNGNQAVDNTYEWCAPNVTPQKELLQNEPLETIDWWIQLFRDHRVVVIEDIEDIREQYPLAYAALKPQDVTTLVTGPIYHEQELVGFFGVDNPDPRMLTILTPLLHVIGYFIDSLLRRRDLILRLEELSFHDSLTGALNRNALSELDAAADTLETAGILYCDISGLKQVNDTLGHDAGDALIRRCYETIRQVADRNQIYRTGGDEFVVVLPNLSREAFLQRLDTLRQLVDRSDHHMAVGHMWTDRRPIQLRVLITQADQIMYRDKRDHYRAGVLSGDGPQRIPAPLRTALQSSAFNQFIQANHFDAEALFTSLTLSNRSYFLYFGDLQTNMFYISDNMRDTFGFHSNVVPDLLNAWAKRIPNSEDLALYRQDLADMMANKRVIHDLRYRVRDCRGNHMWIRCTGLMQWNEERTKPIFFSGCISTQDEEFVVDSATNLPREAAAIQKLQSLSRDGQTVRVIGFSLNGFTDINRTKGRYIANQMLQSTISSLSSRFGNSLFFYRLDGMRFMALVSPECSQSREALVHAIRASVEESYRAAGVLLRCPCSFGLLEYPTDGATPHLLLENAIDLIATAKDLPNQPYVLHSHQDQNSQRELAAMAIQLNRDIYNDMANFRVVVQPIVSAKTGRVRSGETLLRWRYLGKDVSPTVFIPMLERSGQIVGVGKWIFDQVARCCRRLLSYDDQLHLSFNVSYLQILDDEFLPFLRQTLEKYDLDGRHLTVELTETHFVDSSERLRLFIEGCQALGLEMALDDFGAGYSSLALLLQFPSGIVKLDRSLLTQITTSPKILHFIQSIVFACHRFGQQICAEGVETEEQAAILRDMGCELIQGYHYYRPMELRELYELIARLSGPAK